MKTKLLDKLNKLDVIVVEYIGRNQNRKFRKTYVYVKLSEKIFVYYSKSGVLKIRLADTILNNARGFGLTRANLQDFLLDAKVDFKKFYKDVHSLMEEEDV